MRRRGAEADEAVGALSPLARHRPPCHVCDSLAILLCDSLATLLRFSYAIRLCGVPRLAGDCQAAQNGGLWPGRVAELHVLKLDVALELLWPCAAGNGNRGLLRQELKDAC